MSDHKPGTVAIARIKPSTYAESRLVFRVDGTDWQWVAVKDVKIGGLHDGVYRAFFRDVDLADIRPLVVIDPEDPERVRGLWTMAGQHFNGFRAALRESTKPAYLTPPKPTPTKPKEPERFGALVEDPDAGAIFVRQCGKGRSAEGHEKDMQRPWLLLSSKHGRHAGLERAWSDFPATVKVLRKGVKL